jgi:hypothetical protein
MCILYTGWIKTNLLILSELVYSHYWNPKGEDSEAAHMSASRSFLPPRALLKPILFKALRFA